MSRAVGASFVALQHCGPGVAALTASHGTFRRCGPDVHQVWDPLPADEPPAGMFG